MPDLKKPAIIILLITIALIIIMNLIKVYFVYRLFIETFGIGSSIVLFLIGNSKKYKDL